MKTLRIQIVVSEDMVSIETPTLDNADDFYFSGMFDSSGIVGAGMQANHIDPEWPEMKKKLLKIGDAAIEAWKIN